MKTLLLGEVAQINPKPSGIPANTEVSFVGMADLNATNARTESGSVRQFADVSKGYTIFEDGDILVAKITPCFENNKIGQACLQRRIGVGSTEFHVIRTGEHLDGRYLLHFLRQDHIRHRGELRMTGSAGQRRVPADFLRQLELPLPPLDEQRRIAAILDHADELRGKEHRAVGQLDALQRSLFHHMFGDPINNERGWKTSTIGDVCTRVTDGEHKTPRRSESGVPLLSARSVQNGWIDFEATDFIPEEEYELLRKRIEPLEGDILISCSGTIGRVARVDRVSRFAMVRSVALVRPGPALSSVFLQHLLSSARLSSLMNARANSSAQANLFQNQIKALPVILPPLGEQKEFEARTVEVDRLRVRMSSMAVSGRELFSSLQSRAFSGQLGHE